jgi:predicted RNA binding protein YcfA (HicA-like mRNA interferase family)
MEGRLPRVNADEIIRVLKKRGFVKVDQSGSHQKWRNPDNGRQTIIAYHRGDIIRPKTFVRILEGAGITVEEFENIRKGKI